MNIKEEVKKTLDMLKKAGMEPIDAIFEGAISVKEKEELDFIQKMDDKELISGTIRIIYLTSDKKVRFIDIFVGEEEEEEESEVETMEKAPKRRRKK